MSILLVFYVKNIVHVNGTYSLLSIQLNKLTVRGVGRYFAIWYTFAVYLGVLPTLLGTAICLFFVCH